MDGSSWQVRSRSCSVNLSQERSAADENEGSEIEESLHCVADRSEEMERRLLSEMAGRERIAKLRRRNSTLNLPETR